MRNVIEMALKLLFFAAKSQKSPSGWGLCPQAPSVISLSCISLFSTTIFLSKKKFWGKTIFEQKKFTFELLSKKNF